MSFTYVTVTHTFEDADDTAASGVVEFTPIAPMRNDITVVAAPVKATLATGGVMSQKLAANTDPGTTPTGTTYRVVERLTGQVAVTYYVQVPHDQGANLDLRTLAGWQGGPGGGGGGTGSVNSVNGIDPDGSGDITLSASDVGAQLASAALTRLAAAPVTLTAVSGTITPNATLGTVFRHDATADVTLAAATGGAAGQPLEVQVYASGGTRTLSLPNGLASVVVSAGATWWGHFSYNEARDKWLLDDTGGGSGVGGGGAVSSVNGQSGVVVLDADDLADGTSRVQMTTSERTKLAGVATGATANSSDATLLNRANHTGSQAISTVTGLQTALDGKSDAVLTSQLRSTSVTLAAADMGVEQVYTSSSAGTFTLPNDTTATITVGVSVPFRQSGTGVLTIAGQTGVTISSRGSAVNLAGQHAVAEARKIGANAWLLYGDIL